MVFGSVPNIPVARLASDRSLADDIVFEIKGHEMQFCEIELDPGEAAITEAGSMMFKDPELMMNNLCGDGSHGDTSSLVNRLIGAGKRLVSGETLSLPFSVRRAAARQGSRLRPPIPAISSRSSLPSLKGASFARKILSTARPRAYRSGWNSIAGS